METLYTYLFRDPKDNRPIYVGKGQSDRAFTHGRISRTSRLSYLIRKRKVEGYAVVPIINYEVDEQTALQMEMFWIDFYGREDLNKGPLFNLNDGGTGVGGTNKGKPLSDETKAKISAKLKGRPGIPNPNKGKAGKPCSEETKRKLSEFNKGKKLSDETREKMSRRTAHNKGKPMSPEAKEKLAAKVRENWADGRYDSLKKDGMPFDAAKAAYESLAAK
jgi:hypothetical protein